MSTIQLQGDSPADVKQAAGLLQQGKLVAVPTETVYGLAANAADEKAVQGIYQAKGRPSNHPLIVHVGSADQLTRWARDLPAAAQQLAATFWPGPLTLLLHKHPDVNPVVTGGLDTIGLRMPNHPVLLALLKIAGLGVAAPSANRYKKLSPTTAEQVLATMQGRIDAVLDGGPCEVGIESTILDLTTEHPRILRPGPITAEQISAVLQQPVSTPTQHQEAVPGNVDVHYQPGKPLWLMTTAQLQQQLPTRSSQVAMVFHNEALRSHQQPQDVQLSSDKAAFAQNLYHTLYRLDPADIEAHQ